MNNQPAFPENYVNGSMAPGMTLRDYFAAKAITGFTSATSDKGGWTAIGCSTTIAEEAYKIADAMLKAREL